MISVLLPGNLATGPADNHSSVSGHRSGHWIEAPKNPHPVKIFLTLRDIFSEFSDPQSG